MNKSSDEIVRMILTLGTIPPTYICCIGYVKMYKHLAYFDFEGECKDRGKCSEIVINSAQMSTLCTKQSK